MYYLRETSKYPGDIIDLDIFVQAGSGRCGD